jgi:EmrB/QacA subfamily drug resistance transporter
MSTMHENSGFRKWLPLVVMALALFIVVLDTTIINVSIKAIINDLHSNIKAVQWVITGYALVLAAFTITGGRLGDIFGRKKMFIIGAVVFGIGSLLASQAHSATQLFLFVSIIEGLGASLMLPATASLIVSQYRGKDRAIAFGVYGAIAGAAATIGPILGGFLTTNYSWRWNYLINPVIAIILIIGSIWVVKEAHERQHNNPDILSIILSALGLAGIVYGFIESSTYGWIKAKEPFELGGHHFGLGGVAVTFYALILGLIFLTLFLGRQRLLELAKKPPLVSTGLLTNRAFMSGTVVLLVTVIGQFGLIFALPVFLQGLLGKDAFHSGLATIPLSLAILVSAPLSGVLASKWNVSQRLLIQVGLVFAVVGGIFLHQEISLTTTVPSLIPGLVLFGIGFGLTISQLANLTLSAASVELAGEASGVNNTFRQIGTSVGQALIGALLISSLVTQLNQGVSSSKVLPAAAKPQIAASIATSAESLGADQPKSSTPLPPAVTQEIILIKNEAIVHGVRVAFVGVVAATALALVLSTQLPKRAIQHSYDEPATAGQ